MQVKASTFSKEILSELVRNLLFGAFVVDRNKRIMMLNDAALKTLKAKSAEDLIGKKCHNNVCPAEKGNCPVWDLGMRMDLSEKTLIDCMGEEIPILKTVSPLIMDGEEVLLETFVDITDRKNVEVRLKESESKYRIVADNTYDWEFWLSPEGGFLYSSPSCERITGYPAQEFIDDPTLLSRIIHPDDIPVFIAHRHDLSDRDGLVLRIIRPDGEERWIEHFCQGVYGPDGKYLGHRGSNRNITKRKLAEQAATKAKEEWERTFDSIEDPIMILDTGNRIIRANRSTIEMSRMAALELEGSNCYKIFHGLDKPPKYCPMTLLAADGKPHNTEVYLEQQDRYYHVSVSPMLDSEGRLYGAVHHAHDITDIKIAESVLISERNRAQKYMDMAGVLMAVIDTNGTITHINRKGCDILGYEEHEAIGRKFDDFLSLKARQGERRDFDLLMAGKEVPMDREIPMIARGGEERVLIFHVTLLGNKVDGVTGLLVSGDDITERKNLEAQLTAQARHDQLTGLPNRSFLQERLVQEMARARRNDKMVGVLYLDLDRFKSINDSLGHDFGDSLLKSFAGRLKDSIRVNDMSARLGGDEFIIVLSDMESRRDISTVARKIIDEMACPFDISGLKVSITPSIGISVFPDDGDNFEVLLKKADVAMYKVKEQGRNDYCFYSDE